MGCRVRTKNAKPLTTKERAHLLAVRACDCSVCGAAAPSSAHHIKQGAHFTTVALCWTCHQGPYGWHGDRSMWRIHKMDEIDALNVTLGRIASDAYARTGAGANVGGEARLAAHRPSHTTTATPQGVASTDQLGGRFRSEKE